MYQPTPEDLARIENNFTHHPPKGDQNERYEHIREECQQLAACLLLLCPPSRERSLAMGHLEETMMWANASIARNE
jgi:hypothetical protein